MSMESDTMTVLYGRQRRDALYHLRPNEFRQFDHGYAVTSHSSQGLTADRVLAHFDTDSTRSLINNRLAYVAISRASDDARIYTNDAATLGQRLATDVTKTVAIKSEQKARIAELDASKGSSPYPSSVSAVDAPSPNWPT